MKVNIQFWKDRAGDQSLGNQDAQVIAFRKMGYTGTLNDMRRSFYQDITGINDLTTAKARANDVPDYSVTIDYAGKAKGDGDGSRIMKYGANPSLMNPSGFTSEVGGGYAGASAPDDASTAYWSINTPAGYKPQFCFYLTLDNYGTRNEMRKLLKSLKAYVLTKESTVYAFNNTTGVWDKATVTGTSFEYAEIELNDALEDFLDDSNTVKIGAVQNTATDGVAYSRLDVDYFKIVPTFFKQLP